MKVYWLSWFQPTDDHRPIAFPPNKGILGWWCTGEYDGGSTLCAWVLATDEEFAKNLVKIDWPEVVKWRFIEEREKVTHCDRFQLVPWMEPRFKEAEELFNDSNNEL